MANVSAGFALDEKSIESSKRFGKEFRDALDKVAEEYMYSPKIRTVNATSFDCMAACQDDDYSRGQVTKCMANCSGPVRETQKMLQQEITKFHNMLRGNLESCAQTLEDDGVELGRYYLL